MNLYINIYPLLPYIRMYTIFPATILITLLHDENKVKIDLTKLLENGN